MLRNFLKGCVVFFLFCVLNACNNSIRREVEKELSLFLETRIHISGMDLIPFHLTDTINLEDYKNSKYKIYTYIDSMGCSECKIKQLKYWTELFRNFNTKASPVLVIFNTSDYRKVRDAMELYNLDFPYFLDINNQFKKLNTLPEREYFRTFH